MSAASAKRPRIWVPGITFVADDGELTAGLHVGFNGHGKAFAASRIGHAGGIQEWRHRAWLVVRADLEDELVEEHAIILPETLLDPDELPHARRWLASQPLVCVSGAKVTRLLDAGLRIYTVEHGAEADDWFAMRAEGGERASWSLALSFADLVPAAHKGEAAASLWRDERFELRTLADRVLDEVSRGILREASVVNALASRSLVEPGYGYRGAPYGTAATVEEVARAVRGLEALFRQVYARAAKQQGEAKEIARALRTVPADARSIDELPVYNSARKVILEEVVLPMADDVYQRGGDGLAELCLPEQPRWFVDRVQNWRPKLDEELERELEEVAPEATPPPPWVTLMLTGVLVVIVVVGYLVRG